LHLAFFLFLYQVENLFVLFHGNDLFFIIRGSVELQLLFLLKVFIRGYSPKVLQRYKKIITTTLGTLFSNQSFKKKDDSLNHPFLENKCLN